MKIFIDGRQADIDRRTQVAITLGIASYTDLETSRTGYSKSIVLPITVRNEVLFGAAGEVNAIGRFNDADHTARIERHGCTVLEGVPRLVECVGGQAGGYYRINILGAGREWVQFAARTPLRTLEVPFEEPLDADTIRRSWTWAQPVRFLPVVRDTLAPENPGQVIIPPQRVLTADDYHPFLHLASILKETLFRAGYALRSEFIDGALFGSLYMSGNYGSTDTQAAETGMDFLAGRITATQAAADHTGRVYATPYSNVNSVGNIVDTVDPAASAGGVTAHGVFSEGGYFRLEEEHIAFRPPVSTSAGFEYNLNITTSYRVRADGSVAGFDTVCLGGGESMRQLLNTLAFDKCLFGNAFVEVVTDRRHTFLSLYHQDATRCRVSKDRQSIILHHDWRNFRREEACTLPLYPAFAECADGTLRSMVHYRDYEPMFENYGVPPYIAGMSVSAIAYKTDRWNISRLDNSFQLSGVMVLDGTVESEAEAEELKKLAKEQFAGKPGQVMFVLKDCNEQDNSKFIPIDSSNDGDWRALHEQATGDIVVAHSWFRSLSGLEYGSGFSSDRILHEYEVALNTVILSEQEELMEPLRAAISLVHGVDCSSLQIVNRPPARSKPLYMRIWEARKAEGLEYDPDDAGQQLFVAQITKYALKNID